MIHDSMTTTSVPQKPEPISSASPPGTRRRRRLDAMAGQHGRRRRTPAVVFEIDDVSIGYGGRPAITASHARSTRTR